MQQADKAVADATFFIVSMVSWLWSVATFVVEKSAPSRAVPGRDLVVLGLCKHAELPQLFVELLHERLDSRTVRRK